MTHIKFTAQMAGDPRWIAAGPDAFTVHMWSLLHCDQQLSDGFIAKVKAERVADPVPVERTRKAIAALVAQEFWAKRPGGFQILDYTSYALTAEEIRATRGRWSLDRNRRRRHNNGNHDLCTAATCAAVRGGHTPGHTPGVRPPIPNQTQPDPTEGLGLGEGDADAATAGAEQRSEQYAPHPFRAPKDDPDHCTTCGGTRDIPHLEVVSA